MKAIIVIVAYNDSKSLARLVRSIDNNYPILVFDNSTIESESISNRSLVSNRLTYITNFRNEGIGYALNTCLNIANKEGYEWIITFDQDSISNVRQIDSLLSAVNKYPKCVSFASNYNRRNITKDKRVDYAITSGNLLSVSALINVGGFDSNLFIDGVDFDISLKLINKGYEIYFIADAIMDHEIGGAKIKSGYIKKIHTRHSYIRRYYQYRNLCILTKRYVITNPKFIVKLIFLSMITFFCNVFNDDNWLRSTMSMVYGALDGIDDGDRKSKLDFLC